MVYKFYFYTNRSDSDYDTTYSDKNIKTELVSLDGDPDAILYAAETVADMRDEIPDFKDSADAEIYLDDLDYDDYKGFCFAITRNGNKYIYGDPCVMNQFISDAEFYSLEDFEDMTEDFDPDPHSTAHLYQCDKCKAEIYREKLNSNNRCPYCDNKSLHRLDEEIIPYKSAVQFFDDNVDDDNDKVWDFLSKRNVYVNDLADIPDEIDGQKILYRFSSGRNSAIDIYHDAYKDHVFVKLPKSLTEFFEIDNSKIIFRADDRSVYTGKDDEDLKAKQYVKISVEHPILGKFVVSVGKFADIFKFDVRTDGKPWPNVAELTSDQKDFVDKHRDIFKYLFDRNGKEIIDLNENKLIEDTVKQGKYWVNKGKEGTHGKFRTKKAADAQRKAMFAQGFKESLTEAIDDRDIYNTIDELINSSEEFLAELSELDADNTLTEDLALDYEYSLDDIPEAAGEFSYPIAEMKENIDYFTNFSNITIKLLDRDLIGDHPFIDVAFIEKPDISDGEISTDDEVLIDEWYAEYINYSHPVVTGMEKWYAKLPKSYYIDTVVIDPDTGNKYRVIRTDVDIEGDAEVVTHKSTPIRRSVWPPAVEDISQQVYCDGLQVTQTFHIEKID